MKHGCNILRNGASYFNNKYFSVRAEQGLYQIRTGITMIFLYSALVLSILFFWHVYRIILFEP